MSKLPIKFLFTFSFLLLLSAVIVACGGAAATEAPQAEEPEPCPTAEPCPTQAAPAEPAVDIPFLSLWEEAGHSDAESEAFVHWNEDDPPVIPENCAACHSTTGFHDFIGADGSAPGVVNSAPEGGEVITCVACHNETTLTMDSVTFPHMQENEEGDLVPVTLEDIGQEAVCMVCHQGRASTYNVNAAIEEAGVEEDTVSEDLGFINIHYYAAAATRYGTLVKGGYQYDGKTYDALYGHAKEITGCDDCHDAHSLELKLDTCAQCHVEVESVEDVRNIRMVSSLRDYDGDGNIDEPITEEIGTLQEMVMSAMQTYATEVAGSGFGYEAGSYPYFFVDSNGDGEIGEDEAVRDNAFGSWTPRLLKAAYNYQVSLKDPGGYTHNGKYIIQLLYDSIEDLNTQLSEPVDLSMAQRIDVGHYAGSTEAFRHWDDEGEVPANCAKCHSAVGLPQFLEYGANIGVPISDGLQCETCHDSLTEFSLYEVSQVTFPNGATLGFEEDTQANLCLECHQGRSSTVAVNRAVSDLPADTVDEGIRFLNIHYFAAGATLFGSEAQGIYQYEGNEYAGPFTHIGDYDSCSECHSAHQLTVNEESCNACHGTEDPGDIRSEDTTGDFDGDGDTEEGLKAEVEGLEEILYQAIQTYSAEVAGTPLIYSGANYPYFFIDSNANGEVDGGEAIFPNQYNTWTPRLLQAAYNYQYAKKDPGAYSHNPTYTLQGLYDSIASLNQQVSVENFSNLVRP